MAITCNYRKSFIATHPNCGSVLTVTRKYIKRRLIFNYIFASKRKWEKKNYFVFSRISCLLFNSLRLIFYFNCSIVDKLKKTQRRRQFFAWKREFWKWLISFEETYEMELKKKTIFYRKLREVWFHWKTLECWKTKFPEQTFSQQRSFDSGHFVQINDVDESHALQIATCD